MKTLIETIDSLRRDVPALSGGVFYLEEYILLPHYGGNVMLRFGLDRSSVTAEELDALERELNLLVPEGFFCDFMGEVYARAGLSFDGFEEKLIRCAELYADEPIPEGPFAHTVRVEAARILAFFGLPEDAPVWEIQPDEGATALLILSEADGPIGEAVAGGVKYEARFVRRTPCEGLMRAAAYAKRTGTPLMSAVFAAGE